MSQHITVYLFMTISSRTFNEGNLIKKIWRIKHKKTKKRRAILEILKGMSIIYIETNNVDRTFGRIYIKRIREDVDHGWNSEVRSTWIEMTGWSKHAHRFSWAWLNLAILLSCGWNTGRKCVVEPFSSSLSIFQPPLSNPITQPSSVYL